MITMSLGDVAKAVSGVVCDGDDQATVTGPWFVDSRQVVPGGLFAAMTGEHADGHEFAAVAVATGAAAVLASRPVGVPAVVVADVPAALGQLAAHLVTQCPQLTVIGITGSNGKTTTKDLTAHLLRQHDETVATAGNQNNEIGVPLTVSKITARTRTLILELGARGVGHIEYLTGLAPPTIGAVLNVGSAHIGPFGGIEQIALGKGELVEALPAGGAAVLNADDARVLAMADRTRAAVTTFGRAKTAAVRARDVTVHKSGTTAFALVIGDQEYPVSLPLAGEHQVMNALAAAAIALRSGMTGASIAAGLASARPASPWRMEVTEHARGLTVINDAYNANPHSVRAALAALRAIAGHRRSIAVLGPMHELGPGELPEHREIGAAAARSGVSHVLAVGGTTAESTAQGALAAGAWAAQRPDIASALAALDDLLEPGDAVLVKGSRAAGLERLAQALRERHGYPPPSPFEGGNGPALPGG